jgi:hypothetical protein
MDYEDIMIISSSKRVNDIILKFNTFRMCCWTEIEPTYCLVTVSYREESHCQETCAHRPMMTVYFTHYGGQGIRYCHIGR